MQDPTIGNVLVVLVLLAGAGFIARGLWMLRNAPDSRGHGARAERGRQRCMAWVVAGCTFMSIPALVGYVSTPPEAPVETAPAVRPL